MKTCSKCKEEKSLDKFSKKSDAKDGLHSWCKLCKSKQDKKHYQKNSKRINEHSKQYYKENTESQRELNIKLKNSIPAGVYEILYKGVRKYVGQSSEPYRRFSEHFSCLKNLDNAYRLGPVAYRLSLGEIKRKDLSYNMLEYINDEDTREQVEKRYITESTALWNRLED